MRVNSANVLDEGLRIGGRGCRMNSKVRISQTRRGFVCIENKHSAQLAQSQSVPGRVLLAPIYRWLGLEDPVGFNTNYNICIRYHLVFRLHLCLGFPNGPRDTKILGFITYILVSHYSETTMAFAENCRQCNVGTIQNKCAAAKGEPASYRADTTPLHMCQPCSQALLIYV
jgi:hypothetical protein